jgi:hypothetical protein
MSRHKWTLETLLREAAESRQHNVIFAAAAEVLLDRARTLSHAIEKRVKETRRNPQATR